MHRRFGLTIVECLIAMTILSMVVLVTCHVLVAGQEHIRYGDRIATAARLGNDMLEEIASREYCDPNTPTNFGPEAGETRAQFNDADDYNGYAESAGSLRDFAGNVYPADAQAFSRSVTVTATTQTIADLSRSFPGLSVVVTVRAANGDQWQFSRFIPEPAL